MLQRVGNEAEQRVSKTQAGRADKLQSRGVRSPDKALACLGTVTTASEKQTEARIEVGSVLKAFHERKLGEQRLSVGVVCLERG